MKMVKKILAVLFVALVVTLTACSDYGSNSSGSNNDNANTNTRYQPEDNSGQN